MTPRWEHFHHDADIGVRGIGPTLDSAFEQAALALTAIVTDCDELSEDVQVEFHCAAPNLELLFSDFLNELIYAMSTRRLLFRRCEVHIDDTALDALAFGEPVDRDKHAPAVEPKGATLTELHVARDPDGQWSAQCVVDV
jgi:SHS2 domain-containing protein